MSNGYSSHKKNVLKTSKRKITEEESSCKLCSKLVVTNCKYCQISYCKIHAARYLYWGKGDACLPITPLCKDCMRNLKSKLSTGISLLGSFNNLDLNNLISDN